jgi:hypothetical protein
LTEINSVVLRFAADLQRHVAEPLQQQVALGGEARLNRLPLQVDQGTAYHAVLGPVFWGRSERA